MFTGFTDQTIDFLWGIRFNNERSWFLENKNVYLTQVLAPMRELGEELYNYIASEHSDLPLNLHVSRIYRDARRLYGRGPYKDHLWLSLRRESEQWTSRPVFYFEIAPEYYAYGMGFYSATPQIMERFRNETMANPRPLTDLAEKLVRHGGFQLEGATYARPKPSPTPLLADWMNRKTISISCERAYDDLSFSPDLCVHLKQEIEFLLPYYRHFEALCR